MHIFPNCFCFACCFCIVLCFFFALYFLSLIFAARRNRVKWRISCQWATGLTPFCFWAAAAWENENQNETQTRRKLIEFIVVLFWRGRALALACYCFCSCQSCVFHFPYGPYPTPFINMHVLSSKIWYFNFPHVFVFFLRRFVVFFFLFYCFSRAFSLDFVVEFPQRKLVLYRVARGEGGGGNEGWEMRVEAARLSLKQHSLSLCAWVGVWLRFVYVHLSGFNVRISPKRKRFTFQQHFALVSAVSCPCFTIMCGTHFV